MGKGFWVVLAAVVVIMIGAVMIFGDEAAAPSPEVDDPHEITDSDFSQGESDAPITLVKYSDFQCPACGAAAGILEEVKDEYGDDLQFVYRFFNVTDPALTTRNASLAAIAAGEQGSFWEMHDLLFERQQSWSGDPQARSLFDDYAEELGLDMEQFDEDFDNGGDRVDRDIGIARQLGVQSTPTFFLNGEQIQNPMSMEAWRELLDEELAEA